MQRRHHRHGETRQQHQDVGAGFAAENSEFMLEPDCFRTARLDLPGGVAVGVGADGVRVRTEDEREFDVLVVGGRDVAAGRARLDPAGQSGSVGQYSRSMRMNGPPGAGSQFASLSLPGDSRWT